MVDQVIFISICTRQKKEGGSPGYRPALAIGSKMNHKPRALLLETRSAIRERLKELEFDGIALEEENDDLIPAGDFGGTESSDARYLPAIDR